MKKTPFHRFHVELGARMHEFAGYDLPIDYKGIIEEHLAVINSVGVFDVSHMGEFWVKGPKALEYLQKITSNDVSKLEVGKIQYAFFPNEQGGIKDDFLLYHYEDEKYMLVPNAANIEKDWAWCQLQNTEGAELENASDNIAQLAVQGPKAKAVLQTLTAVDLDSIPYYTFKVGKLAGCDNVIISNTGYTGCGGFELYFYPQYAETIWKEIFRAGEPVGIMPCGLGARDTLRLEMGFCLYGNDIDEDHTAIESGLGWITKVNDSKPALIGREVFAKQRAEGVSRKLVGFVLEEKGVPRQGYEITTPEGEVIGNVTSGTMSPYLKKGIGMGYVDLEHAQPRTKIGIKVRNKILKAEVVKVPFRK